MAWTQSVRLGGSIGGRFHSTPIMGGGWWERREERERGEGEEEKSGLRNSGFKRPTRKEVTSVVMREVRTSNLDLEDHGN